MWRALSPWRAIADGTVWVLESTGREARPVLEWTGRWGRYPGAVALFSFVALELANPRPAYPRTLAIATALYSYWALAGMAIYGRDAWTRYGEGFAVAFELLSRIAPFAVRDGSVVVRWPFTGLGGDERVRGTLVFVAVMLGSTSFDGFSRTSMWQNLIGNIRADLADSPQRTVDLATTLTNVSGLALFVLVVATTYLGAVSAARALTGARRSLVPDFVLPLVPIAAAYLVAHYFSLFLIQGQFIITLASDPFGRGWDLFGTVDFAPNLAIVSPGDGVVRPGRVTRRRPRRRARDRARSGRHDLRGPARRSALPVPDARVDGALHGRRPMAPLAWLVAHGGVPGAIAESALALFVIVVLGAVWLRERRGGDEPRVQKKRRDDDRRR